MYALICQGNGTYYTSAVFGYFQNITATDDFGKYLQSIHNPYWIVFDQDKKRLTKWKAYVPNTNEIIPQILIIDSERSNWIINNNGEGCINFLSKELLDSFLDKERQPENIINKCRLIDSSYKYEDVREIKTQKDIDDLDWTSGNFHDAFIEKEELRSDGTLYLLFNGCWGCKIEMWFWDDLEYDTSSRDPEIHNPHWYGSTMLKENGFIYFVDEEDMTVEKIREGYCYFKARRAKYRVIPN